MHEDYISTGEAAKMIGVSYRTLQRYIEKNVIPSVKVGGKRLIKRSDIEKLFKGTLHDAK